MLVVVLWCLIFAFFVAVFNFENIFIIFLEFTKDLPLDITPFSNDGLKSDLERVGLFRPGLRQLYD